ncbi:MAG: helix-turn-helix transcriptional regulator [bacterium]|nr:helix-turn-helix transcriptional regulator [bacterium]
MSGLLGLKQARKSKNLTQKQLADMSGLSVMSICLYERGAMDPALRTIKKLAEILGVSPGFLITGRE